MRPGTFTYRFTTSKRLEREAVIEKLAPAEVTWLDATTFEVVLPEQRPGTVRKLNMNGVPDEDGLAVGYQAWLILKVVNPPLLVTLDAETGEETALARMPARLWPGQTSESVDGAGNKILLWQQLEEFPSGYPVDVPWVIDLEGLEPGRQDLHHWQPPRLLGPDSVLQMPSTQVWGWFGAGMLLGQSGPYLSLWEVDRGGDDSKLQAVQTEFPQSPDSPERYMGVEVSPGKKKLAALVLPQGEGKDPDSLDLIVLDMVTQTVKRYEGVYPFEFRGSEYWKPLRLVWFPDGGLGIDAGEEKGLFRFDPGTSKFLPFEMNGPDGRPVPGALAWTEDGTCVVGVRDEGKPTRFLLVCGSRRVELSEEVESTEDGGQSGDGARGEATPVVGLPVKAQFSPGHRFLAVDVNGYTTVYRTLDGKRLWTYPGRLVGWKNPDTMLLLQAT